MPVQPAVIAVQYFSQTAIPAPTIMPPVPSEPPVPAAVTPPVPAPTSPAVPAPVTPAVPAPVGLEPAVPATCVWAWPPPPQAESADERTKSEARAGTSSVARVDIEILPPDIRSSPFDMVDS